MKATISVNGLEFYAYHGVPEAERTVGHRYVVDIAMEVDQIASTTDDVTDTVDYAAIMALALAVGQGEAFRTVEKVAAVMGERILAEHPRVESVEVFLRKPLPPAPFVVKEAGVRLRLTRNEATPPGAVE